MAKRLCEFNTSSSHFGLALHLYAWAIYRRGDVPDADEFAYISKRILNKYPTAEYGGGEVPNKMRKLADRIEAAWNRRTK